MMMRTKIVVGAGVAVVVLVVVALAVYLLTRDDPPEAVDLESTIARLEAETTGDSADTPSTGTSTDDSTDTSADSAFTDDSKDVGTTSITVDEPSSASTGEAAADSDTADADTGQADTEAPSADETTDPDGGLGGVWAVQVAEGTVDLQGEPAVSFAGFRVNEVLAGGIGDFTAVGRTADVSGSIELSGNVLVAATVEVTMSTLKTDNGSRDGQVRRALNTNEFPLATFTLTAPVELPAGMAEGEGLSGSVDGELTIKGVTNAAVFDLQAQLVGDTIVAVGSSHVVFSDYGVRAPTAPIVVSVEDNGIMEFQLIFTR